MTTVFTGYLEIAFRCEEDEVWECLGRACQWLQENYPAASPESVVYSNSGDPMGDDFHEEWIVKVDITPHVWTEIK